MSRNAWAFTLILVSLLFGPHLCVIPSNFDTSVFYFAGNSTSNSSSPIAARIVDGVARVDVPSKYSSFFCDHVVGPNVHEVAITNFILATLSFTQTVDSVVAQPTISLYNTLSFNSPCLLIGQFTPVLENSPLDGVSTFVRGLHLVSITNPIRLGDLWTQEIAVISTSSWAKLKSVNSQDHVMMILPVRFTMSLISGDFTSMEAGDQTIVRFPLLYTPRDIAVNDYGAVVSSNEKSYLSMIGVTWTKWSPLRIRLNATLYGNDSQQTFAPSPLPLFSFKSHYASSDSTSSVCPHSSRDGDGCSPSSPTGGGGGRPYLPLASRKPSAVVPFNSTLPYAPLSSGSRLDTSLTSSLCTFSAAVYQYDLDSLDDACFAIIGFLPPFRRVLNVSLRNCSSAKPYGAVQWTASLSIASNDVERGPSSWSRGPLAPTPGNDWVAAASPDGVSLFRVQWDGPNATAGAHHRASLHPTYLPNELMLDDADGIASLGMVGYESAKAVPSNTSSNPAYLAFLSAQDDVSLYPETPPYHQWVVFSSILEADSDDDDLSPCPPGTVGRSSSTLSTCATCPINTYNDENGASACLECDPQHLYCPPGATTRLSIDQLLLSQEFAQRCPAQTSLYVSTDHTEQPSIITADNVDAVPPRSCIGASSRAYADLSVLQFKADDTHDNFEQILLDSALNPVYLSTNPVWMSGLFWLCAVVIIAVPMVIACVCCGGKWGRTLASFIHYQEKGDHESRAMLVCGVLVNVLVVASVVYAFGFSIVFLTSYDAHEFEAENVNIQRSSELRTITGSPNEREQIDYMRQKGFNISTYLYGPRFGLESAEEIVENCTIALKSTPMDFTTVGCSVDGEPCDAMGANEFYERIAITELPNKTGCKVTAFIEDGLELGATPSFSFTFPSLQYVQAAVVTYAAPVDTPESDWYLYGNYIQSQIIGTYASSIDAQRGVLSNMYLRGETSILLRRTPIVVKTQNSMWSSSWSYLMYNNATFASPSVGSVYQKDYIIPLSDGGKLSSTISFVVHFENNQLWVLNTNSSYLQLGSVFVVTAISLFAVLETVWNGTEVLRYIVEQTRLMALWEHMFKLWQRRRSSPIDTIDQYEANDGLLDSVNSAYWEVNDGK